MLKVLIKLFLFSLFNVAFLPIKAAELPDGFVYLKNIDPSILQDIRYAGFHNFIGRPIKGYEKAECILTKPAAIQLAKIQSELKRIHLSLKVYDCYRPQMAVADFVAWSKLTDQHQMKAEFYPHLTKINLFPTYVAKKSSHSRGSTIDLTLVTIPTHPQPTYEPGQTLVACFASYKKRFKDNGIDMGTGFDCMDKHAHPDNKQIENMAYQNRMLLQNLMRKYNFVPYTEEWWHFTLKNEPYPDTYFNFPIN